MRHLTPHRLTQPQYLDWKRVDVPTAGLLVERLLTAAAMLG